MAAINKKRKSQTEQIAQAARSNRNKLNRIRRNKKITPKGFKNDSHRRNLASRRLAKLNKKIRTAAKDRKEKMEKRITELEIFLR